MTFVLARSSKASAKGDNYFYGRTSFDDVWFSSRREGEPIFYNQKLNYLMGSNKRAERQARGIT